MPRGSLRVYLGAAPGVGKTVAMLGEGVRRRDRGTDVVVGVVETHDRPYTAHMVGDLEVIPRVEVEHRGSRMAEMDVDAILARRPVLVLVDELAHTNVPGSRHEKRWQDVKEILDAGIGVITTVNIQHLESLNDAVAGITGVRQRETVPDHVVRAADQIELVDMTPEALRRRLAHGNVYKREKVDAALANYFRPGNLAALRELALLWLADRVDERLTTYRREQGIQDTWATRERVLVALTGGDEGSTLLRTGARIASRGAGGELHAVYVDRADGLGGAPLPAVAEQRRLTESLGGTFHVVSGEDTAEAILELARAINATQIVLGTSRRPLWRRLLSPGVGESVVDGSGDIDVLMTTHHRAAIRRVDLGPGLSAGRVRLGWVLAVVAPLVLLGLLSFFPLAGGLPLQVLLYLLLTVVVAAVGGLWPALVAAVSSSLLINWFFTPPVRTLTISDPQSLAALLVFVAVALLVSAIVHTSVRRTAQALAARHESAVLVELSHSLLGATDQLGLLLDRARDMFHAEGAAIEHRDGEGEDAPWRVLEQAGDLGEAADRTKTVEPVDEDHRLVLVGRPVAARDSRLLAAFAAHAGAILTRRALRRSARTADDLARDNRARTALLSAVSHDLRTPLAGIKAAVTGLRSTDVEFSPEDEAELLEAIEDGTDRLDALIGNLLDMSRIQTGALAVHPRDCAVGPVVAGAVATVSRPELVQVDDCEAEAHVDPGLLERVLGNLVENALRHGGGCPVTVSARADGHQVVLRVADSGPGADDATRERMFLPFQRYSDQRAEGVGLGLAIARGLTEAMHGTLEADDTPGGGLTMVVTLPAAGSRHTVEITGEEEGSVTA
ncbi:ATP-binding protein [uncultured Arsenicicoccus sp.]|uniref:ATP-binding protein n=1 Tax=uncultured Arsenicicoccus sp. TaxID=491339 RepID=UPI002596CAF8|nr:ATP-binding protein [uncultured Arsenicicoccus sp.]